MSNSTTTIDESDPQTSTIIILATLCFDVLLSFYSIYKQGYMTLKCEHHDGYCCPDIVYDTSE